MKNKDYIVFAVAVIVAFLLGVFLFSGGGNPSSTSILSSAECEWEYRYQGLFGSASVYRDITAGSELRKGGFVAPLGIDYEEVEFVELGVIASTTENDNRFLLNDVDCGVMDRDIFVLNDYSTTCKDVLKKGLNNFNSSKRDVIIHEIYVGMRYRPANCLR